MISNDEHTWQLYIGAHNIHSITSITPGTPSVSCSSGTPFQMITDATTDPPVFSLSCNSAGGPIRGFSCSSTDTGSVAGTATLRNPYDVYNLDFARYDLTVMVTGRHPGDFACQVTVELYDGTGVEPETLTFPGVPGSEQTIRVTGAYNIHTYAFQPVVSQCLCFYYMISC